MEPSVAAPTIRVIRAIVVQPVAVAFALNRKLIGQGKPSPLASRMFGDAFARFGV
jgi:hypothetical protein